jgi:superoxide dismutase, Cu-Zn family
MKAFGYLVLPLAAAALVGASPARKPAKQISASAKLFNAQGVQVGKATIFQRGPRMQLVMYVQKQSSGYKAVHVHTTGLCSPPDFMSAGLHWNPENKKHGRDNPMGPHAGDIENIRVEPDGVGRLHSDMGIGSLFIGKARLIDNDGASLVVHESADDFATDPSGNSGKRVVCGVFARD